MRHQQCVCLIRRQASKLYRSIACRYCWPTVFKKYVSMLRRPHRRQAHRVLPVDRNVADCTTGYGVKSQVPSLLGSSGVPPNPLFFPHVAMSTQCFRYASPGMARRGGRCWKNKIVRVISNARAESGLRCAGARCYQAAASAADWCSTKRHITSYTDAHAMNMMY